MDNIIKLIKEFIKKDIENSIFKQQLEYCIFNGKYLRSLITYSIGNNLNLSAAIEYIHNSSLLIDDMPFMDNDITRRGIDSLHVKFGQSTTLLISYNLIISAMDNINKFYKKIKVNKESKFIYLINKEINIELSNLIKGQYMDLNTNFDYINKLSKREQINKIIEIINFKTGSLFYLSFLFGYISKNLNIDKNIILKIKNIGYSFGMCFQILDDLEDFNKINENKLINIRSYYNKNELIKFFSVNLDNFRNISINLNIYDDILNELYELLIYNLKKNIF